jgi:hypothetical protein
LFPVFLIPSGPSMWLAGMIFGYGIGFVIIMVGTTIGMVLPYLIGLVFRDRIHVRQMIFHWYNLVFILDLTSASPSVRIISCWMCSNGWRDGPRKLLWLDLLGREAGSINLKWLPSLGFHHFPTQFSTMQ